jgi:hypothetical protein
MLIAVALAATIAAVPSQLPPMIIHVAAARDIKPTVVAALLAETDAVLRSSGLTFLWVHDANAPSARAVAEPERPSLGLHVSIGHATRPPSKRELPLGWIVFDNPATPEQEIYLSYEAAVALMDASTGVLGSTKSMPVLKRDMFLARAMGRALAHELGHYLTASKAHAPQGLMRALLPAFELFGIERKRLMLAPADRERIVERMASIYMASRG